MACPLQDRLPKQTCGTSPAFAWRMTDSLANYESFRAFEETMSRIYYLDNAGLWTILSPAAQATSELKTPFFTARHFCCHRGDTLIFVTRERWGDEWWMRSQSRFVLGEFVKLWDVNMRSIATFSMHEMIKLLSPVVFSSQYSLLRAGFLSGWIHRSLLKNC